MLFAKIAGQDSQKTTAKLLSFLQGASYDDIQQLFARLRTACNPPLLYFCEYLDYWSTGEFLAKLQAKAHLFHWSSLQTETEVLIYYFYPLKQQELLEVINPLKTWPNPSQEDKWFLLIFEQCLLSWEELVKGDSAVLLARSVFGGTLLDDEIMSSRTCDLF
jgi:hypothetical protein